MQKIILATNNAGKVQEFQQMLSVANWQIVPQSDLGIESVEETGLTFIENAILKARHAAQVTGLPALADDSGLVIDALNGAPGIYSARYSGAHADFAAHISKVLVEMTDVPEAQRSARFYCALAYLTHPADPTPVIACGSWSGQILFKPCGTEGFGYDPIFWLPTHHCSAAELATAEKNQISHRAQALRLLLNNI